MGELLYLLTSGSLGNEVDLRHLEKLLEDQVPTTVAVHEGRHHFLLRDGHDRLRHRRALHSDGVLDAGLEEVQDVRPALHHDDGVGVCDVRSGGELLRPVAHYLGHLDGLSYLLLKVQSHGLAALHHLPKYLLRSVDDVAPLGHADVFYSFDGDLRFAGTYPVNGL